MSKTGIDISSYQKNVNYNEVANNVDFAILRAGYGVQYTLTQRDSELDNHYNGLKNDIPLGAYYYSYATNYDQGRKEAENCLRYIEGKTFELPIFIDLEEQRNTAEAGQGFVDRIREEGLKAGIYASSYFYKSKGLGSINCDCLWIAGYGNNIGNIPSTKPSVDGYDIWQYTSKGHVNGIDGYVDMNISYDDIPLVNPTPQPQANIDEVARQVINGEWGNGQERKDRLTQAGYDYNQIQDRVNQILGAGQKSIDELAQEVINGQWGNGEERKQNLINAGYDYNAVQNKVNEMLGAGKESIDDIARRVIRGDYGNGQDRANRLRADGYDPDEVQQRVNEMLS